MNSLTLLVCIFAVAVIPEFVSGGGVAKRLVLISDGRTRPSDKKSETLRQADELRKMGVRIVVMSLVNSYKPESDIEKEIEFNQITGGRGFNIIDTNNFGSLLGPQGPLPSLINAICAREDGTGNTVNPAGVTTTQAPIITNPPVIITTQAPFITNPPATTINPFQTTTVRGDPHVSCVLPSGDRICFDAYGDPGKTYLFFDDKLSRTKVLATFVSVEASTSSKDLLFVDTVYIQSQSINIIATISGTSILDHETGRETKLSCMKSHKSKHTFGNVKAEIENRYLWIESPEFGRVAVMKYNNHLDFDLAYDKSVVAGGFVGDICSSAFTKASMPTNKPLKFNSKHFFTGNHEIKNGVLTANGVSVDLTMRKGCYKPVSDTSKEGINRILEDYLTDDDDLEIMFQAI
ncbi:unnamed protein product [Owenia fusiformis]|uniref:VWFA domain-containing protein n=1 Tax=Owenia fusiformis TaxID=6347 RepID=A0A8S4NL48_OWEFU|nr:unnamed protein product [Owenia fusiformis]